jgi:hypothetical protein
MCEIRGEPLSPLKCDLFASRWLQTAICPVKRDLVRSVATKVVMTRSRLCFRGWVFALASTLRSQPFAKL